MKNKKTTTRFKLSLGESKKFILLGVLLLMVLAPMVLALDFTNSMDNVLSWAESNSRVASAILFLVFFLAVMWILVFKASEKLGWGDNLRGAKVALAAVLAVAFTWGMDVAQSQLLGYYLIPDYAWVILVLAGVMALAIFGYGLMSKTGTTNYTLMGFLICLGIIGLYHILEKFMDNFPSSLGDWGGFVDVVYGIAAIGLVILTLVFIWNNLISGVRLKSRAPRSDEDMDNLRKNYTQKQVTERLAESEREARKARKTARVSRKDVRKMKNKITDAQKLLANLRQDVVAKNAMAIKGTWLRKGRGKLKELEKLRGIIRAYIGLISELSNEMVALPGVNPTESTQLTTLGRSLLAGSVSLGEVITKISDEMNATSITWNVLSKEIDKANDVLNRIDLNAKGAIALEEKMRTDLGRH